MSFFENISENILQNIFDSWTKCKANHTYVENISNANVILSNMIIINNINNNYDNVVENIKRTIYFDKCNNLEINIDEKFNHILLVNCHNINIKIKKDLISGLDILNSKNINIKLENKINYTEISNSNDCNYIYNINDTNLTDNVYINTNLCYNINFVINYICFNSNLGYFLDNKYFIINNNFIKCVDKYNNEINF
jgi:hypothetical protein